MKDKIKEQFEMYKNYFSEKDGLRVATDDYVMARSLSKYIGDELALELHNAIYEYYNTIA